MEYYNKQSNWLDQFLTDQLKEFNTSYGFKVNRTYFWYEDVFTSKCVDRHIAFRVPGATRGHFVVSCAHEILDVILYDETCFRKGSESYKPEIKDHIHKLKGVVFDMNGFTDEQRFEGGKEVR